MPGTVVRVLVAQGEKVDAHQPLVVLEAMKMEYIVTAPYAGIVRRLAVQPGALVTQGALLIDIANNDTETESGVSNTANPNTTA